MEMLQISILLLFQSEILAKFTLSTCTAKFIGKIFAMPPLVHYSVLTITPASRDSDLFIVFIVYVLCRGNIDNLHWKLQLPSYFHLVNNIVT
jgi:hypothetical protein